MDGVRAAPLVGIVGCLGVIAALVYPYVAADGAVGLYYSSGVISPLVTGLLALVTIIVLAAGREDRTDPELAAGAGLVFGLFIVALLLAWAMTTRVDTITIWQYHRWVLPGIAVLVPLGSLWYARALRIF
ncbi:MAG: hypothetical protein V5A45_03735 [Haloarculaceae archaeon]